MKKLMFTMMVVLFGISSYAQNTENLFNRYLSVKNSLVASDGKAAGNAITGFSDAVKNEGNFSQKAELAKAADKLTKAGTDIEKQRLAFNDVSVVMWKIVKNSEKVQQPVYYQYCPMKKANWLSADKDIKNPYYGSAMLTCGKTTDTK